MKGIILCAGRGSRLAPFTDQSPKTMLPLANKPILSYLIQKLINAGIDEIGVVINKNQHQIIKYLKENMSHHKIEIFYQEQPLGIAQAILSARHFIGDESFVTLLGDNLIFEPLDNLVQTYLHHPGNKATLLLHKVDNPVEYGVVEVINNKIVSIEEKPKVPKSNLAIAGMYIFDPIIFGIIDRLPISQRGEYEITDAIGVLLESGHEVSSIVTNKSYIDIGTKERWIVASRYFLEEKFKESIKFGENVRIDNCKINGPVVLGNNITLVNSVIGPYVAIGDNSIIKNGIIMDSVCLENSDIYGCKIYRDIIGPQSKYPNPCQTDH